MAIETPENAAQVATEIKTDVQRELSGSNPFAKNHWLGAIITGIANRLYDFYIQLKQAVDLNIPDTATGIYLERWKTIFGITTLAATKATGNATATGTAGATVTIGATMTSAAGNLYAATASAVIAVQTMPLASITRIGDIATATTLADHFLGSNVQVTISGASLGYNGTFTITVINSRQFTFEVNTSQISPAPAPGSFSATFASVPIEADIAGSAYNLESGEVLTLQSPIVGVNSELAVDGGKIGGGNDTETEEDCRERLLERIVNPVAQFNEAAIQTLVRSVNGVTRVFVQTPSSKTVEVTITASAKSGPLALMTVSAGIPFYSGQPITVSNVPENDYNLANAVCIVGTATQLAYWVGNAAPPPSGNTGRIKGSDVPVGTVKVFFMRDNDPDPIPSGSEVITVKNLLLGILPANTSSTDLVVAAPVANPVDFTFLNMMPNTGTMQEAVTQNLKQLMIDRTSVGFGIPFETWQAAITNTYDSATGERLQSFEVSIADTLGSTTNILGASGKIPLVGQVTFP